MIKISPPTQGKSSLTWDMTSQVRPRACAWRTVPCAGVTLPLLLAVTCELVYLQCGADIQALCKIWCRISCLTQGAQQLCRYSHIWLALWLVWYISVPTRGIVTPPIILLWHGNSLLNYNQQNAFMQSVHMYMHVHWISIARDAHVCMCESYNKLVTAQATLVPCVWLLAW